jgi:hypothetical protein
MGDHDRLEHAAMVLAVHMASASSNDIKGISAEPISMKIGRTPKLKRP